MLRVGLLVLVAWLTGCSDEPAGKKIGESCVGHEECASRLCTSPPATDGAKPAGKVCVEPNVR